MIKSKDENKNRSLNRLLYSVIIPCSLSIIIGVISVLVTLDILTNVSMKSSTLGDIIHMEEDKSYFINELELTKDNYKKVMEYYEIQYPDQVLAQALIETGHFTSYNCLVRNNTLGLVNSRLPDSPTNKHKYFTFDHWTESIKGYKEFIEYKIRNEEDYYSFLERINYAEAPNYTEEVKRMVTSLKKEEQIMRSKELKLVDDMLELVDKNTYDIPKLYGLIPAPEEVDYTFIVDELNKYKLEGSIFSKMGFLFIEVKNPKFKNK